VRAPPALPEKISHPRPSAGGWRPFHPNPPQPNSTADCQKGALLLSHPEATCRLLTQKTMSPRGQINDPSGGEVKGTITEQAEEQQSRQEQTEVRTRGPSKKRIVKSSKICQTFEKKARCDNNSKKCMQAKCKNVSAIVKRVTIGERPSIYSKNKRPGEYKGNSYKGCNKADI